MRTSSLPPAADETVDAMVRLSSLSEPRSFAAGSLLFSEGSSPDGVYIIRSGDVALEGAAGGKIKVRTASAGEMLGLNAVISAGIHATSAVATTACETGFIERDEFCRLVDSSPAIWFCVLRQLSQDVSSSYDVIRQRYDRGKA
jgi:CRP-like cAMP-binding protein